ncbi:MAG: adenylyl-sulfate kinase [Burkholderiales bacterium]|nr:adenylyl-sulfate kinase [Burkholderiales bacterium]
MNNLIPPYADKLTALIGTPERQAALKLEARDLVSIDLTPRQTADLELLINGGYSPLTGYMNRVDYDSVAASMRLANGTFWPVPIALEVTEKIGANLVSGVRVALRDAEGFMLAVLTVGDVWPVEGKVRMGGALEGAGLPQHHDFTELRQTPEEMRHQFARRGWRRILAFQPEHALFRPQYDFIVECARSHEASLLLHPVAGEMPADEVEYFARIHGYEAVLARSTLASTALALLPLPDHGGGLRTALLKAIVARNYGCTHVVLEGVAESELAPYSAGLGLHLISLPAMVYVEAEGKHLPTTKAHGQVTKEILSAEELHRRLERGQDIPEWFAFPEVVAALRRAYPPRPMQGVCIFFTGFSGSGKSTLAKALMVRLLELGGRQVTLLDGDIVRKHLSSELGFSREHRDLNIRRIGYVASEIVKHRGVAICAPIAPYAATRHAVRHMIEQYGGFFEIHVATPIEVCESRDRKGLYAKARAGLVKEFTGVSDPYEVPKSPELVIDTSDIGVDEAVQRILLKLEREGYLR